MTVLMCADFVPSDKFDAYLEELRSDVLPLYWRAAGLMSVTVLKRQLIAYGEVATLSCWSSQDQMSEFLNNRSSLPAGANFAVIRKEAVTYEIISP